MRSCIQCVYVYVLHWKFTKTTSMYIYIPFWVDQGLAEGMNICAGGTYMYMYM